MLDADSPGELMVLIEQLELIKNAAAAAQARLSVRAEELLLAEQEAAGVPASRLGRGIADQIGLARHESPCAGSRHLQLAKTIAAELPAAGALFAVGRLSEFAVTRLAAATAACQPADRAAIDAQLCGGADPVAAQQSPRQLEKAARALAYAAEPEVARRWSTAAEEGRYVSIRPAENAMVHLSALLPLAQGVAVHAALDRAADRAQASGDARSRQQCRADALVERVTGQAAAPEVPVEIQLVMTDGALLGPAVPADPPLAPATEREGIAPQEMRDGPAAVVPGFGPVAAGAARELVWASRAKVWLRRLWTDPPTGRVSEIDQRRRLFPRSVRRLVIARDQVCRTPWCDGAIRDIDHIVPWARGGPTGSDNAQGLCARCNRVRAMPDWDRAGSALRVITESPSGQVHVSEPPPALWLPHAAAIRPARARPMTRAAQPRPVVTIDIGHWPECAAS